jgi:hypothetical protein
MGDKVDCLNRHSDPTQDYLNDVVRRWTTSCAAAPRKLTSAPCAALQVIAAYLATLMAREKQLNKNQPRVHFCNTWFYEKLYTQDKRYSFSAAKRTFRALQYDVTKCEQIVVPIHIRPVHWTCAEIDLRAARITYFDSTGDTNITSDRERILRNLQRFMEDLDRSSGKPERDWSFRVAADAPRQLNGWDCGVFTLMACKWRALQLPFSYDQRDMDYFRRRIMADIISFAGPPQPESRATPRRNERHLDTHTVHQRSPRRERRSSRAQR